MWPFRRRANDIQDRRREFWSWFTKNEKAIHSMQGPDSPLVGELGRRIKRVHPGLVWEVGPIPESGQMQFVISADGIREVFDEVEALADAAPDSS